MHFYGSTHVGRLRPKNEDSFLEGLWYNNILLSGVADGMGGHSGGDIASYLAVEGVKEYFHKIDFIGDCETYEAQKKELRKLAESSVFQANQKIMAYKEQYGEYLDMGTTLTIGVFWKDVITIGHVGDSRAYYMDANKIYQLTEDHSLVNQMVKSGKLDPQMAEQHPQKNILTQALGTSSDIDVDIVQETFHEGSLVLFCTDGLTDRLGDSEIYRVITHAPNIESAGEQLIAQANDCGGHDNITVTLVANGSIPQILGVNKCDRQIT